MRIKRILSSAWTAIFGDPVRAFGVVSFVLLIALAIAPAKEHFSEWHRYQRQYLSLIRDRGDAVSLRRRFKPGIHQIWLPDLGVVDRCTTCHLGLNEAGLADVHQQPFTKHPAIPHSLDGFGCVICHGGQGAATTVSEAHSSERAGEEPIIPARYIESGCGQCHQDQLPGTPQLNLGRSMLRRSGCVHCHAITLPDGTKVVATDHPPSLAHIADKTTREWIFSWLKDPQAYSASTTMPDFKLSDADADDISAYLMSTSMPLPGDSAKLDVKSAKGADLSAGPSLYGESFCSSCHAVQNAAGNLVGGNLGPELTRIGNKAKPEWLLAWLRIPALTMRQHRCLITASRQSSLRFWPDICRISRIQITVRMFIWTRGMRRRLPTGESSLSSWVARRATKSMGSRNPRISLRNSVRSQASRLRRSFFCRGWSIHSPVTSRRRFVSREHSAQASKCRNSL